MDNNEQENQSLESSSTEDVTNTSPNNTNAKENKHKSRKPFVSHLMSGLAGGVISAAIIVTLVLTNVIPISGLGNNQTEATPDKQTEQAQHVSTDLLNSNDQTLQIENTTEAVVGVTNLQQQSMWESSEQAGAGTGVIYKKENGKAYVVTNNHVVANAKEVKVDINKDKQVKATVLGTDPLTDLAVLEIDDKGIDTVASFASSKELQVGQTVAAIGNPLGSEFAGSVTKGIISGLERSIEVDTNGDRQPDWVTEVIQTDAAINPGNSGGALVNSDGKVIGINSMKIAQQAVEGIGFAIPSDTVLPIIEQLETEGKITRPLIGISTAAVNQVPMQYQNKIALPDGVEGGMVIADVQDDSPAQKAGLKQFDIITKINDEEIKSLLDLRVYMYNETKIGDTLKVEFSRDGKLQTTELTLTDEKEAPKLQK